MKADILLSLRGEIAKVIKDELKSALAEDFQAIRSELQAVRSEIANSSKTIQAEVDIIKTDVLELKGGLSTWSDEVTSLQSTVTSLQKEMSMLKEKCEDLEGRMRRSNIRIGWEFKQVIKSLKNNKSPGPDGYTNDFYKTFIDLLAPLLLKAYHHALKSKTMALSWSEATIVVIHKEGKDPIDCQSYRPISLLNTDLRILTGILVRRLNKFITQIIHPDQTGFIAGRYSSDNLRHLLNLISDQKERKIESAIISLDAQKAFDKVSWKYLIHTLKRFGFGPLFVDWVQTLYSSPQAAVKVNGFRSDSTYADDVLLYLAEPKSTIPHLKELISQYGFYSGYKINIEKTEAMDVNGTISDITKVQSGFKWPKSGIKYLGIYIPPSLCDLYEANYSKLLRAIKNDLGRWDTLPISLIGRVESIHMNVLPRLSIPDAAGGDSQVHL
uniref:Reverse transcriptase domain-containing protein n=1 Tax=Kryptolebias marmoratus TaxID=37003 RepID=A0A3Q3G6H4_KRYMA